MQVTYPSVAVAMRCCYAVSVNKISLTTTDGEDQHTKEDVSASTSTVQNSGATPRPSVLPPVGSVYEGNPSLGPSGGQEEGEEEEEEEGKEGLSAVQERRERREEKKLAIMMMSKKRKRLYDQIMKSRRKKAKEVKELKRKRREFDQARTVSKRAKVS